MAVMSLSSRRNAPYLIGTALLLLLFIHLQHGSVKSASGPFTLSKEALHEYHTLRKEGAFNWVDRVEFFPINTTFEPLPKTSTRRLPKVQHAFRRESTQAAQTRVQRQAAVKESFQRCWESYRTYAWLKDELTPLSGTYKITFGGWAATLVDSLDTLWIMGMREEFEEAVEAALTIDFTNTTARHISVFETNIRYLGGLLSAFDLSGDQRLALKALELGHVLYAAFDTPNRMPINDWNMQNAAFGETQEAPYNMVSAQIGSLSLEFTRLSQISGDARWYDAIHRIGMHLLAQQEQTMLPGMWPITVDPRQADFSLGSQFTLGANADSLYEYLPKLHTLLGGSGPYLDMYNRAMEAAIPNLLFKPMVPDADILFAGAVLMNGERQAILEPRVEHLVCFVGGMLMLGGKLAQNQTHLEAGSKMARGCAWAYNFSPHGVMPEIFEALPCDTPANCTWDEEIWLDAVAERMGLQPQGAEDIESVHRIPKGFTGISDRSYILRPEAIESVFILYRTTGDADLMDIGWKMFESVDRLTRTEFANARVVDVTASTITVHEDSMESFWTAETLKYFYLLFSEPSLIDLDEYVFNTEAHPLKRP